MSSRRTFMEACLAGAALLDDVDDWVEDWHEADGQPNGYEVALREYLGLSTLEYAAWAERPSLLRSIVAGREQGRSFQDVNNDADLALVAARTKKDEDAKNLVRWLQETGRLDEPS
ncbi:hypothetical protein Acsp07_46270 [Actinomycetospora sp. NBRC 106378]|nr:hypothetical protein Acsp07_46270 [Actinomycetospora sp. NBRC 106378]